MHGEVRSHGVDIVRQILPGAGHTFHHRLAAQFSLSADFAGHACDFRGKRRELVHHDVNDVLDLENLPTDVDRDLLRQIAVGDGRRDLGDVAQLHCKIRGHKVDVIGEVLPGPGHTFDLRLASEFSFRSDFARHACHFRGKGRELVHHRVDGVLEFENFAFDVDGNFLGKIAVGHGGRNCGNVAHLRGEGGCHEVHRVGQVLPRSAHTVHFRLATEDPFRAHFARDTSDFRRERSQLIHHRIDGVFEFEKFSANVDRDLFGQVSIGHSRGHCRDVTYL